MALRRTIVCADGFEMSVQASKYHYCTPRRNDAVEYSCVEVGFPNECEWELMPWAQDPDTPTSSVYSQVPATVIRTVIEKHGGIVTGELPPMTKGEE